MKKLLLLLLSILISYSTVTQAKAVKCYTKNEVGEMSYGEDFIFERTNKLDKSMMNLFLSQRNNSSYIRTGLGTRTGLGSVIR